MREITERELNLIVDEMEGNANIISICYNKENDEYYCFTSSGKFKGPNIIFSINCNYYMDSGREKIKEDIKKIDLNK